MKVDRHAGHYVAFATLSDTLLSHYTPPLNLYKARGMEDSVKLK